MKGFRAAGKLRHRLQPGHLSVGRLHGDLHAGGKPPIQFWMQPGASLQSTGLASEDLFFKRFFDKYGITADFQQREQYKNAVNPTALRRLHACAPRGRAGLDELGVRHRTRPPPPTTVASIPAC